MNVNLETQIDDVTEITGEAEVIDNAATDDNSAQNQTTEVETISMSKLEFEKAVQGAEDKVRNKLHKKIKELETELSTLRKPEMSDSEKELEKRIVDIEAREKAVALKSALHDKSLDLNFADYLRDSVDIESFNLLIERVATERVKSQGYVPKGHQNNVSLTFDDWSKMTYAERVKFNETNPDLALQYAKTYK